MVTSVSHRPVPLNFPHSPTDLPPDDDPNLPQGETDGSAASPVPASSTFAPPPSAATAPGEGSPQSPPGPQAPPPSAATPYRVDPQWPIGKKTLPLTPAPQPFKAEGAEDAHPFGQARTSEELSDGPDEPVFPRRSSSS